MPKENKVLIVAHPDDEILWFDAQKFDKIVIAFMDRLDNYKVFKARERVLEQHPLKDKIISLGLTESGWMRDRDRREQHLEIYETLKKKIAEHVKDATVIYTHNSWGEYNHPDHIMVNHAVKELAKCDVMMFDGPTELMPYNGQEEEIDLEFYKKVRELYIREGAWTWNEHYMPRQTQRYFKL